MSFEDLIEIRAERMQDRLDAEFLSTEMSQDEYDRRCGEIAVWVHQQYEEAA
jgi:hypothetical protein